MSKEQEKSKLTGKKTGKASGHEQVVEFLTELDHPLKKEIEEVRTIILGANDELTEHIKWNAPSFCYKNEDRVTFNLQGKGFFRLIFHCGAKVKEDVQTEPLFDDETGLLEWTTNDRAILKLTDMNDVNSKKEQLIKLVKKWLKVTTL